MPNERLIELAIKGLEIERTKIDRELAELRKEAHGGSLRNRRAPRRGRKRVSRLSAAGRRRLSEAAKRRWAVSRKLGKKTL